MLGRLPSSSPQSPTAAMANPPFATEYTVHVCSIRRPCRPGRLSPHCRVGGRCGRLRWESPSRRPPTTTRGALHAHDGERFVVPRARAQSDRLGRPMSSRGARGGGGGRACFAQVADPERSRRWPLRAAMIARRFSPASSLIHADLRRRVQPRGIADDAEAASRRSSPTITTTGNLGPLPFRARPTSASHRPGSCARHVRRAERCGPRSARARPPRVSNIDDAAYLRALGAPQRRRAKEPAVIASRDSTPERVLAVGRPSRLHRVSAPPTSQVAGDCRRRVHLWPLHRRIEVALGPDADLRRPTSPPASRTHDAAHGPGASRAFLHRIDGELSERRRDPCRALRNGP